MVVKRVCPFIVGILRLRYNSPTSYCSMIRIHTASQLRHTNCWIQLQHASFNLSYNFSYVLYSCKRPLKSIDGNTNVNAERLFLHNPITRGLCHVLLLRLDLPENNIWQQSRQMDQWLLCQTELTMVKRHGQGKMTFGTCHITMQPPYTRTVFRPRVSKAKEPSSSQKSSWEQWRIHDLILPLTLSLPPSLPLYLPRSLDCPRSYTRVAHETHNSHVHQTHSDVRSYSAIVTFHSSPSWCVCIYINDHLHNQIFGSFHQTISHTLHSIYSSSE